MCVSVMECSRAEVLEAMLSERSSVVTLVTYVIYSFFFFQAEDGIRDLVRSRGLGDVYKRQVYNIRA